MSQTFSFEHYCRTLYFAIRALQAFLLHVNFANQCSDLVHFYYKTIFHCMLISLLDSPSENSNINM